MPAAAARPEPFEATPAVAGATAIPPLGPTPGLVGVVPFEFAGGDTAAVCEVSPAPPAPGTEVAPPRLEGAVVDPTTAAPAFAPGATLVVVVVVVWAGFEQAAASRVRMARAAEDR
jgi:hypothetical protein